MDYALNLLTHRNARRMSQAELAQRLKITQGTVAKYESGKLGINYACAIRLSKVFKCSAMLFHKKL